MKRHLVLCSVPWRAASLERCLRALKDQLLDEVSVLRAPGQWPPLSAHGARFVELEHNYGPSVRWRFIRQTFAPEDLALVLDDDFEPAPDYVVRTTALIERGRADATGWYGVDSGLGYIPTHRRLKAPRKMLVLAGGACAMRAYTLARVEDDENYLRSADDGASSKSMRQMGARMLRPAGRGPLESTSAQFDARSIKLTRSPDAAKLFVADWLRGD